MNQHDTILVKAVLNLEQIFEMDAEDSSQELLLEYLHHEGSNLSEVFKDLPP